MTSLDSFEEDLKKICKEYAKNDGISDRYNLTVLEENYPRLQNLLKKNGMTYVVRDSETYSKKKKRLLWSSSVVRFFKVPFYFEKQSTLICTNGPNFKKPKKKATPVLQDSNSTENPSHESDEKPPLRKRKSTSKKVGCNATMRVVNLKTFPEYCIKGVKSLKEEKQSIMKELKRKLNDDPTSVVSENVYQITFSTAEGHCHPVWTSFTAQHIDPALKNEIRTLVTNGITDVQTIKVLLCKWVKENVGDVNNSSRAYWPTKKTILNHIRKYATISTIRENKQSDKQNKTDSKTIVKIKSRKKRRTNKDDSYQPDSTQSQPTEKACSSADLPVIYDESFYLPNYEYSPTEANQSEEQSVSVSEIRDLIRKIYDRSFLLPHDYTDSVLYGKLQDVINLMNNCIDRDQIHNITIPMDSTST